MGTNKLMQKGPLFQDYSKRIYDPNVNYFQDGGERDGMNAMMKAKLAYANEFGNPAAKRMINIPDNPYQFDSGDTGTHYMASMDNYAVPQIQDENGQLTLGDYGPDSREALKFDSDDDAQYFAEHYKEVSPGFMELELTDDEIEEYRKGGFIVEDISVPELNQAQKGGQSKVILSKEHTDKKGNKTIVVTKDDGTKYTKVISKDDKVYNNTQAGLSPEMRAYDKKKAEWENRSSGAAQPVDDFWTLPIGMTSAGVKGAVGLAKGLTSLGRNALKSSLVQSGKAGTKALFNTSIKNLPGANLKNLINVGFAGAGANKYIDENSDVRRAIKNAYDNPTGNNIVNAINENTWNALNFSGLNVGKGVKQLGKYATTQTPLKNTYKVLPEGTFKNYSKLKLIDQFNNILQKDTATMISKAQYSPIYIGFKKTENICLNSFI
jgi:hypothetical protein